MLNKFDLLSVKQLAAKINFVEVLKSIHMDKYPLKLDPYKDKKQSKVVLYEFNQIEFSLSHAGLASQSSASTLMQHSSGMPHLQRLEVLPALALQKPQ